MKETMRNKAGKILSHRLNGIVTIAIKTVPHIVCELYVIYMENMHNACPGDTQVMYVSLNWNSGPSIKPSFHSAPLASRDLTRR